MKKLRLLTYQMSEDCEDLDNDIAAKVCGDDDKDESDDNSELDSELELESKSWSKDESGDTAAIVESDIVSEAES